MWVHGLRRFGGSKAHRVRLDNKLVCFVGSNEVGKTTLLEALQMVEETRHPETGHLIPVDPLMRTRGEILGDDRVVVRLEYRLERAEKDALAQLRTAAELSDVRHLIIDKLMNGQVKTHFDPVPVRDKQERYRLAKNLSSVSESTSWPNQETTAGTPADEKIVNGLRETLGHNFYSIGEPTINQMGALADWLDSAGKFPEIAADLRSVAQLEQLSHPIDEAKEAIAPLIPKFIEFNDQDRAIADEYDLELVVKDPPSPLKHLAALARLDLQLLLQQIQSKLSGSVQDQIEDANRELEARFSAWSQEPKVRVSLDTSHTNLLVHVSSGSGARMKIQERSEGLKQFVALVALTAQQEESVSPILLIDEAELHLHYNAQSDLIAVLSQQDAASQVIYTTHSPACLPEDLGSAVRVVEGIEDQMASTIRQNMWTEEPGFGPLLMALGAGSYAFVPLRPAVIVEGGSDLILLPSLFQEAIGSETLEFQTVPGAANAPPKSVAGLEMHGTESVWLLDGDQGGKDRRSFLLKEGVSADRIVLLETSSDPLDLEDLVEVGTYVAAVQSHAESLGASKEFTPSDLSSSTCSRHQSVSRWFWNLDMPSPSKGAIANRVLDQKGKRGLLEPKRRTTVRKIYKQVRSALALPE